MCVYLHLQYRAGVEGRSERTLTVSMTECDQNSANVSEGVKERSRTALTECGV